MRTTQTKRQMVVKILQILERSLMNEVECTPAAYDHRAFNELPNIKAAFERLQELSGENHI